jgi:hypothetical protein
MCSAVDGYFVIKFAVDSLKYPAAERSSSHAEGNAMSVV